MCEQGAVAVWKNGWGGMFHKEGGALYEGSRGRGVEDVVGS